MGESEECNGRTLIGHGKTAKKRSAFRKVLPQILATTAFGMLIFSVSGICTMPTLVLGALYKTNSTDIPLDDQQASWIGSIVYIVQPLGSVGSGFIQDTFGRRRCMMGVTVPQLIGWVFLYFSSSVTHLYCACVIMGLSIGFMEAPAKSFLGEVCLPRLRGTLTTAAESFLLFGMLFVFFSAAVFPWRLACAVSAGVPVIVFFIVYMMPESPTWLVAQGRLNEAQVNLQWLRGWVTPEEVEPEFNALVENVKMSPISKIRDEFETESKAGGGRRRTGLGKLLLLKEARVHKPLLLAGVFFFTSHSAGLAGLRPYLMNIFRDFNMPVPAYWTLVLAGSVQALGGVVGAITIHKAGKRVLAFVSLSVSIVCIFVLSSYSFASVQIPWIPMATFFTLFFFSGLGVMPIPWILVCEIFPLDARGLGAGISSALCYIFSFLITKSYIDLEPVLGLAGVVLLYAVFSILGFVFLYFRMPETEGKSLAEIELFFDKEKRLKFNPPTCY